MMTNRTARARACIMVIVFIGIAATLSGCRTVLGKEAALAKISSHVTEIQAAVNGKLVGMTPGDAFELDPAFASDLRGLTEVERRAIGRPIVGMYAVEQSADYVGVDVVVAGSGNEGGFSNARRSFYTCVLIEGAPGAGETKLLDRECPQELIDAYVYSYTEVKLSQ